MQRGRVSKGFDDPDELPHGGYGDPLRPRMIVPAPNVLVTAHTRFDIRFLVGLR